MSRVLETPIAHYDENGRTVKLKNFAGILRATATLGLSETRVGYADAGGRYRRMHTGSPCTEAQMDEATLRIATRFHRGGSRNFRGAVKVSEG